MSVILKRIEWNVIEEIEFLSKKCHLTRRETEILQGIALNGYSNSELANHFHIAESTVKNHIRNILIKTGKNSTRELLSLIICLRQSAIGKVQSTTNIG